MYSRGRASVKSWKGSAEPILVAEPLEAPHDLTDEETEVWWAVVNNMEADWFCPVIAPLLAQYCRHTIQARRIAELIDHAASEIDPKTNFPVLPVKEYDRLLRKQQRESAQIKSLATAMRVSQQSTINHRGNKKPMPRSKPWEC